jgi:MGT family glycosyltransferase
VHRAARALGIEGVDGLLWRPISRDLNLLLTAPELEPGLAPLEGPIRMVGPCLERAPSDETHEAVRAMRDVSGPRVYVSLGTVFNARPQVFEEILEGLPRAHVVVSAGASYERLAPRSDARVRVFRSVPQLAVLDVVDVVVTHGGNNTVQECLAAGRPMVVVPFGGDQIDNARRVERLGVGRCVRVEELTAKALAHAIEQVSSAEHARRALALRAALAGREGATAGAEAILELC